MPESFKDALARELTSWPGVSVESHRFGGIKFQCEGKEIGHLHGDRLVDLLLPKAERDAYVEAGRAEPHRMYPESGWISVYLRTEDDARNAIGILRAKYERMSLRRTQP